MTYTSIGMAWWWTLVLILSLGMCLVITIAASGHDQVILQCSKNITVKEVHLLETKNLENGMVSELYGRVAGGQPFIEALSVPKEDDTHDPFPLFYFVDTNGDGQPDTTYEDLAWDDPVLANHCDKIVEIDSSVVSSQKEM